MTASEFGAAITLESLPYTVAPATPEGGVKPVPDLFKGTGTVDEGSKR